MKVLATCFSVIHNSQALNKKRNYYLNTDYFVEIVKELESANKIHLSPTVNADSYQLSFARTKEPILPITRYRLHAVITSTALWATPD